MKINRKLVVGVVSLCLLGLVSAVLRQSRPSRDSAASGPKVLFYQDSMHPWIKSDQPGKCTVCNMNLTPIYQGQEGFSSGGGVIALNSNQVSVLNVQTEEVKRRAVSRSMRVAGTIEANEISKTIVTAPARGRIDALFVDYAGVEVERGQKLITMFSPELVQLRKALLSLRQTGEHDDTNARPQSILNSTSFGGDLYTGDILSPHSGVVVERNVYSGQYVAEGDRLFTIVDAAVLWFRFDVYQQQLPWLEIGQKLDVEVSGIPGKVYTAVISYIEPTVNEATRTIKIRAEVRNPVVEVNGRKQRQLKYGMYAEGLVKAVVPDVLAIPQTAILFPGRSAYAYVDKGGGAYERHRVKLGRQGDGLCEVLAGIEEGDSVVTSGNVLVDAQAQFNRGNEPDDETAETIAKGEPMGDQMERVEAPHHEAAGHEASLGSSLVSLTLSDGEEGQDEKKEMAESSDKMSMPGMNAGPTAPANRHAAAGRTERMRAIMSPGGELAMVRRAAIAAELAKRSATAEPAPAAQATPVPGEAVDSHPAAGRSAPSALKDPMPSQPSAAITEPSATKKSIAGALTTTERELLAAFLAVAANLSQALAADDLGAANQCCTKMPTVVVPLEKGLAQNQTYTSTIKPLLAIRWQPAKDLAEARKQFLPFSTATVELVKQLRKQDDAFRSLKIFHCPMAPTPGFWIQAKGPLRNPFFGSEMLTCGQEVKQ